MQRNIQNKGLLKRRLLNLIKYGSLSIIFLLGIIGIASTPNGHIEPKKIYVLGFQEKNSQQIRVRYSEDDGQTWLDGKFPKHIGQYGVGATGGYADGASNMIAWTDSLFQINFQYGLGETMWPNSAQRPSNEVLISLSAPSVVYAGLDLFVVAFRTLNNKLAIRAFNSKTGKWSVYGQEPGTYDSNVTNRPAIAIGKDKIVLAWNRIEEGRGSYGIIATGKLNISTVEGVEVWSINWDSPQIVVSPIRDESGPAGSPALTYAGDKFYYGYPYRWGGDPLSASYVKFLFSDNGIAWNPLPAGNDQHLGDYPVISMAGRSDGSVLVASVATTLRAIKRYKDGSWSDILTVDRYSVDSPDQAFGWIPKLGCDFALISNKP